MRAKNYVRCARNIIFKLLIDGTGWGGGGGDLGKNFFKNKTNKRILKK